MARIYGGNIRWSNQLATIPSLNNNMFRLGFLLFSVALLNLNCVCSQGNIRPFYPLYFTAQPQDAIVPSGRLVTLNCTISSTSPPVTIRWLKGENDVDLSQSNFALTPSGALRINSVTRTVEGSYHCTAEDSRGKLIVSRHAVISIASLSSSIPSPEDVSVFEGDTARFECRATGTPPPRISWQRDGSVLDLTMERIAARFTLLPSGALEIRNIRNVDAGSYRCQATNDVTGQTVTSRSATLTLLSGNPDGSREFEWMASPREVEARIGRNLVLEAATTEPAEFTWFKDGDEIVLYTGQNHYSIIGQGSLRITDLGEIDTGLYLVKAFSLTDRSTLEKTVRVTAQVPPSFLVQPENDHANVGNPFTFKCSVYGIPPPEVKWYKDGEELDTSEENIYTLVNGQNLQISQLIKDDDGTYQCVASNMVEYVKETIQAAAELIVLDEGVPIPTKRPTTTLQPVITTLKPTSIAPLVPGPPTGPVPSKPRKLHAPRIQARSVTVKWSEPATTNGEIQEYKIHIQAEGARRQRIVSNVPSNRLQWTIDDLLPETKYTIYAYAINENGQGEKSDDLNIETLAVEQVPDAPQNLIGLAESATAVLVSWEPPSSTFGNIVNYHLFYADLGTGQATREQEIPVKGTSYTVRGLDPYTRYGFRVEAFNENGPGPSSEIVEARTFTDIPNSPPSNVSAQPYSASSVLLSWNLPPANQRNGDITGYNVRYRTLDSSKNRAKRIIIDGVRRELLLSELERDTEYEIRIAAVNTNGTGPFTDWILTRTLPDDLNEDNQPPPPGDLAITSYPTKILVRWDAPADTSIVVRGYMLGYGVGFPDRDVIQVSATTRQHMLTNLQPNAQYVIKLRAFNKRGEGFSLYETVFTRQDTSTSTSTPPPTLEVPMPLRVITKSATSAILSWVDQEPGSNDGRIYQFKYKPNYPAKAEWVYVNTTDTTYALNGLHPYTMYDFAVQVIRGHARSSFSMITSNKTFQSAPNSPPKELTIYEMENSTTGLLINWQPPKQANGIITGYTIYYSTDATLPMEDWIKVRLEGDELTHTLTSLTQDTMYIFRIQAHNVKGDSPLSDIVSDTTPPDPYVGYVTAAPVETLTAAGAFPWWIWMVIIATVFLLLILAILIVLCLVCGCCACCASCCPDSDCCGPCAPCCGALARCWTGMCPCCCSDEEECAKCCTGLLCGATCCVCCGQQYKEKRKIPPKVTANGKATSELEGPDLWSNIRKGDGGGGSDRGFTKSPLSDDTELQPLNTGGGVDQQRGTHEDFGTSTLKRQNHAQALTPNGSPLYATVDHARVQEHKTEVESDTYETPTVSHRSSYQSGYHASSLPSMAGLTWSDGALHYASIYDKRNGIRMNGHTSFDDRQMETELHVRSALDTWAEEDRNPPVLSPRTTCVKDKIAGDGVFDVISPTSTSGKDMSKRYRYNSSTREHASEAINDSMHAGYDAQDEYRYKAQPLGYNTWNAGAYDTSRSHHDINNYNSRTYHRDDRDFTDFRTRDYSSLNTGGFQPIQNTGPQIQTLDRRNFRNNYDVNSNQVVTFPDGSHQGSGVQEGKPFTITFEETKTSHQVERSVPLLDGTNYKTVSNHETFAKSYSTSDGGKDRNLQMMLQNGLENGPLAIEIPTTSGTSLPAITAPIPALPRPGIGYGSLTTGSRTTSSSPSSASYHMGATNMMSDNSASHTTNINLTENHAQSLIDNYSSLDHQGNTVINMQPPKLSRSASLDFGVDPSTLPPLGETKRIRPPLLPHRPRAPPDYDTVSRAKKKAASAYNLSHTDASDDFLFDRGDDRSFLPFRSSEFLYGDGKNSTTQSKYQSSSHRMGSSDIGYHTMDSNPQGLDHLSNSFGFEAGTGGGSTADSTERSFASSVYGTSIGNGVSDGGVPNGGMMNEQGKDSLLMTGSPHNMATGRGSNIDSYQSSASQSYQSYNGNQRLGMAGGGAEFSFNNNNSADKSSDDISKQFASLTELDLATAAFPIMPNLKDQLPTSPPPPPPRPRLQRSRSVGANLSSLFDEDKYGFPKLHKFKPEPEVEFKPEPEVEFKQPRGRPTQRMRHVSESQQDLRSPMSTNPGTLRRSASSNSIGPGFATLRRRSASVGPATRVTPPRTPGSSGSASKGVPQGSTGDMHMGGVPGYDYATSPRSLHLNQPPYMYSSTTATSGYHSDTNTASSHEDSASQMSSVSRPTANPLSSFTVPGPPPHYQGRVKISAPTYSPLKRTQGGTVPGPRGRGQPLPVVTPRAPDVTVRGPGDGTTSPTSSARTFSAEDLNAEMINLEGLMKDLNAITASELQS